MCLAADAPAPPCPVALHRIMGVSGGITSGHGCISRQVFLPIFLTLHDYRVSFHCENSRHNSESNSQGLQVRAPRRIQTFPYRRESTGARLANLLGLQRAVRRRCSALHTQATASRLRVSGRPGRRAILRNGSTVLRRLLAQQRRGGDMRPQAERIASRMERLLDRVGVRYAAGRRENCITLIARITRATFNDLDRSREKHLEDNRPVQIDRR